MDFPRNIDYLYSDLKLEYLTNSMAKVMLNFCKFYISCILKPYIINSVRLTKWRIYLITNNCPRNILYKQFGASINRSPASSVGRAWDS